MYCNFLFAITLIGCVFLPLNANAQVIKGIVVDEESNPIHYAGIVLMNVNDSTCFARTYSDINGQFILVLNDSISPNQSFCYNAWLWGIHPKLSI